MKYEIIVNATFSKIRGLVGTQSLLLKIKCTSCQTPHPKQVVLCAESIAYNDKNEKCNLIVGCSCCKSKMNFYICRPKESAKVVIDEKVYYLGTKRNNSCVISIVECRNAEVEGIDNVQFAVVTDNFKVFDNVSCEDGCWNAPDECGNVFSIEDVSYEIVRLK